MQTFSGTDPAAGRHAHFVALYEDGSELVASTARFLGPALGSGGMAVTALTAAHQDALDRNLRDAGVHVRAIRSRGDYLWLDADEATSRLRVDGAISKDAFEDMVEPILATARHRGSAVRFCGELAPRLWASGDVAAALDLEALWDRLPADPAVKIMCLYTVQQLESATPDAFIDLCHEHTDVLGEGCSLSVDDPSSAAVNAAKLLMRRWAAARGEQRALARADDLEAQLEQSIARVEELQTNFQAALSSRDVIGQAKGILMARWAIDAQTAFDLLCTASNLNNTKLRDVAQAAIDEELRHR